MKHCLYQTFQEHVPRGQSKKQSSLCFSVLTYILVAGYQIKLSVL